MPKESIFHKLVKSENSYTQLLCNMMKRDGDFRGDFLDQFGSRIKEMVDPSDIRTQVRLPKCGQADILIQSPQQSPKLNMIVEVKTESRRGMTDKQRLLDNPASYQRWLEKQKVAGSEAWLVFLVPESWKYRPEKEQEIEGYKRRGQEKGFNVRLVLWEEDVLKLLPANKKQSEISLPEEFRLLLEERFGPIGFDGEETMSMFNEMFPLRTVLKLNTLIDKVGGIRKKSGSLSSKPEISKDEFCLYFEKKGQKKECWLYFGCWLDFWKDNHYPICFGVQNVSPDVREAFTKSLKQVYEQDAILFEENWLMGWIPKEDLNKSNAFAKISPKLQRIWKSMSDAAEASLLARRDRRTRR
jgi:hypothetical protein